MALSSETSKTIFVCTGGTVYTVPFYFLQNADLVVYREDADGATTELALTTDYTISGAGSESGGEITTVQVYGDGKIVVVRDVAHTQRLDLVQGDGFRPDTLEQELDRIVMQIQQVARAAEASLQLPESDTSGASTILPEPEAGKVLAWNLTGDGISNETPQYTIVENGSITTEKLADDAVTIDKIDADASTSVRGVVELATPAETAAGADAERVSTPAGLRWLVPSGAVMPFARATPPDGWFACNGDAVSRTGYADLFAACGETFGVGDGSTTFNLPDLRGEFVRGWDNERGIDVGRVFGSSQADELKAHIHSVNTSNAGSGAGVFEEGTLPASSTKNTNSTGGTETRPRNVAMLYCIKY